MLRALAAAPATGAAVDLHLRKVRPENLEAGLLRAFAKCVCQGGSAAFPARIAIQNDGFLDICKRLHVESSGQIRVSLIK